MRLLLVIVAMPACGCDYEAAGICYIDRHEDFGAEHAAMVGERLTSYWSLWEAWTRDGLKATLQRGGTNTYAERRITIGVLPDDGRREHWARIYWIGHSVIHETTHFALERMGDADRTHDEPIWRHLTDIEDGLLEEIKE